MELTKWSSPTKSTGNHFQILGKWLLERLYHMSIKAGQMPSHCSGTMFSPPLEVANTFFKCVLWPGRLTVPWNPSQWKSCDQLNATSFVNLSLFPSYQKKKAHNPLLDLTYGLPLWDQWEYGPSAGVWQEPLLGTRPVPQVHLQTFPDLHVKLCFRNFTIGHLVHCSSYPVQGDVNIRSQVFYSLCAYVFSPNCGAGTQGSVVNLRSD